MFNKNNFYGYAVREVKTREIIGKVLGGKGLTDDEILDHCKLNIVKTADDVDKEDYYDINDIEIVEAYLINGDLVCKENYAE